MTTSFYCACGYHYEGDGEPDWDHAPASPDSCCNCGGQKCMDCCSRAVHDECRHDCPACCPAPDSRRRWVMTIALDAEAPEDEAQALRDAVALTAMEHEPRTGWDAHVSASYESA